MSLSLYAISETKPTDLLIISTEQSVLAGYDLLGSTWRLTPCGFRNVDELRCPVLAQGVVSHGCMGVRQKKIDLNIKGISLSKGTFVAFRPGQILVENNWVDFDQQ